MRILVVSDTHGDRQSLREVVGDHPEAAAVIHLGDGLREAQTVAEEFPSIPFFTVQGNGDFLSPADDAPLSRLERFGGKRVFCTHGHRYQVKDSLLRVTMAAREMDADVLLFGHTHCPLCIYEEGLYILNPGSLRGSRTYGWVDITPGGIITHVTER